MASFGAASGRAEIEAGEWQEDATDGVVPEGVESLMAYRGDAQSIVHQLVGGFRSAMTYSGSQTIVEFHEKAEFVKITAGGIKEIFV